MTSKFLNLKSFHPGNKQNQKKLYLAEEREKETKRREEERAKQVLAEQEYIKNRALLSGSKLEAERSKVGFLYELPANLRENELKQQQEQQQQHQKNDKNLKDVEKFPILANAPVAGLVSNDVKLVHKPFGIELRNVKCARCHNWGHKSGDRECPLLVSANEVKRLQYEDPLANYDSSNNSSNNNSEYRQKFRLNSGASSPKSYGGHSISNYTVEDIVENMNNQQNDDDDDDDEVEREFLASLTKKQRKLLLKQIKLEERQAKKKKKREREKERERHHRSSKNKNYSSDSDYSDSDRDRKKRHKSSSSEKPRKNKSNNEDQYEERVV